MNEAKKLARKKKRVRVIIIIAVALAILTVAVLVLRQRVAAQYGAKASGDVESAQVSRGSVSTTVSGSGYLADEDVEDMKLYSTVEIDETYVVAGERISEGDLLADVDIYTVLSAMSELQGKIDDIDDSLKEAEDDAVGSWVSSTVPGRVKAVYAAYGDDVSAVMYEHGALALISLDGYMGVDLAAGDLEVGDAVTVRTSDGGSYDGAVSSVIGDKASVLISDDGPAEGDSVTVLSPEGETLGRGELYINSPLKVTGYAGAVAAVYIHENDAVSSSSSLFYLDDTAYTAGYKSLLQDRSELEELLQALIVVYKEGAVYAHSDGSVTYVNPDTATVTTTTTTTVTAGATTTTASDGSANTYILMSICPDKTMSLSVSVDESDILSLSVGQEATVTVDSIENEEFPGTVTEIETTASSSNGVTAYTVTVELEKNSLMLAGMSASAKISIEGVDDALLIPSEALHQTSSSSYVYTSYDETTGEFGGIVQVTAGLNNGDRVEITAGLSEGDTVYYTPAEDNNFYAMMPGSAPGGMQGGGMQGGGAPGGGMQGGGMPGGRG